MASTYWNLTNFVNYVYSIKTSNLQMGGSKLKSCIGLCKMIAFDAPFVPKCVCPFILFFGWWFVSDCVNQIKTWFVWFWWDLSKPFLNFSNYVFSYLFVDFFFLKVMWVLFIHIHPQFLVGFYCACCAMRSTMLRRSSNQRFGRKNIGSGWTKQLYHVYLHN